MILCRSEFESILANMSIQSDIKVNEAQASAPIPGFGAKFSAFDYGVATSDSANWEFQRSYLGISRIVKFYQGCSGLC